MKRKKISLVCATLSLLVAMIYVMLTFILLARAVGAKAYVPTAESDLWIIQVLKRLKQTSFNLFFSVMGIVLCFVLAVYRLAIAYFYNKVSKSDETFYKARLGEIVLYSVLSGVVIGVTAWLNFGIKGALPKEVEPFIMALFPCYILLCILPILEIALVFIAKVAVVKKEQAILTKDGVVNELDNLADETAMKIAQKQEETLVNELIGEDEEQI